MSQMLPPAIPQGLSLNGWDDHRARMLDLFSRQMYGITPTPPDTIRTVLLSEDGDAWGGKAIHRALQVSFDAPTGEASFPFHLVMPAGVASAPVITYLSFTPYMQDSSIPVEEILDAGYGLAHLYSNDVAVDAEDRYAGGIAALYPREPGTAWGKLGMWAFGLSRVLDSLLAQDGVDARRIYVLGHSRMGKAALWCAAQDTRFAGAGINNSGCGGIALSKEKEGENIAIITGRFPYWFCENYQQYANKEDGMPFDQHMLAALIAPRPLCVCNASLDTWADPASEYRSLQLATGAYRLHGLDGLVGTTALPNPGVELLAGRIGYALREGTHFLSRSDWSVYLRFFQQF